MAQRSRVLGAAIALLILGVVLTGCGAAAIPQNWPGLTLAGDTLYAISGSPQQVYMLDIENGISKGGFIPQGEHRGLTYWSPVAVSDELGFVGFSEPQAQIHGLYAFDLETGQELWHVSAEDLVLPAPVYADGVVYFGASDGQFYAVDVETRSIKAGWPFQAQEAIWASPLVGDGRVYLPSMDHHLYCLDAATGQLLWDFEAKGALAAEPVLDADRGLIYIGDFDARLYALHADSGQPVEGFGFRAGNWIWARALLADGKIYVTSLDGRLYTLEPASGAVIPPYPFDSSEISDQSDSIRAAPVQAEGLTIIATESGRVIAVKDGLRQWSWPSGVAQGSILTTPVSSGDKVYVMLVTGQVQALDAANGVQGWSFTPPQGG